MISPTAAIFERNPQIVARMQCPMLPCHSPLVDRKIAPALAVFWRRFDPEIAGPQALGSRYLP
jgi:hypothetical protein